MRPGVLALIKGGSRGGRSAKTLAILTAKRAFQSCFAGQTAFKSLAFFLPTRFPQQIRTDGGRPKQIKSYPADQGLIKATTSVVVNLPLGRFLPVVRAGCLLLLLLLQAMPSGAAQISCPCLPPPCPSSSTLDLAALCAQLDAIQAQIVTLQKEHEKKGPIQTLLANRYVDMLLAAAIAAVTVRVMR
jgi:hypothetical protein